MLYSNLGAVDISGIPEARGNVSSVMYLPCSLVVRGAKARPNSG
jgi:hypothetical protein